MVTPTVEKVKEEKKKNVANQRVLNMPRNQSMVRPVDKGKSLPRSQRGLRERTMSVIIVDFKGTPDLIAIS